MNHNSLNLIKKATVRIFQTGSKRRVFTGKGVLLNNGLILTAETCVKCDANAATYFAEGFEFTQGVVTAGGLSLLATPWMIDPVSGIALLGPVDVANIPTLAMELEDFIQKTYPVPLFRDRLSTVPLPIRIQNRHGLWVTGHVSRQARWPHRVLLHIKEQMKNLTAGSPVVTEEGELIGVVPRFIDEHENSWGSEAYMAIAHLALPQWATHLNYKRRLKRGLQKSALTFPAIPLPTEQRIAKAPMAEDQS